MLESLLIAISLVTASGWWSSRRKFIRLRTETDRKGSREITEILPEVAHHAWLSMYSTLFSISVYPPFINESKDHDWGHQFTKLGDEYREKLHEAQRDWFEKYDANQLSPLNFAQEALTSFDKVLTKYRKEIETAHHNLMKQYEGKPMPVRDQNGFNWVRIW